MSLRWRHIVGALAGAIYRRAQPELHTATLRRQVCPASPRCAHFTPRHSATSNFIWFCLESLVEGHKARAHVLPPGARPRSIFVLSQQAPRTQSLRLQNIHFYVYVVQTRYLALKVPIYLRSPSARPHATSMLNLTKHKPTMVQIRRSAEANQVVYYPTPRS